MLDVFICFFGVIQLFEEDGCLLPAKETQGTCKGISVFHICFLFPHKFESKGYGCSLKNVVFLSTYC